MKIKNKNPQRRQDMNGLIKSYNTSQVDELKSWPGLPELIPA